jgi:6-pyruvoyltetrahydropterin/6-carboxytetrahydropterin synthase
MAAFSVRLGGDRLTYSAAHFIVLPDGTCEPIHGHNFRVAAELSGPLDAFHCVVDFIAFEKMLMAILTELDHAVLLPAESPVIRIITHEAEVEVVVPDRRWVFPRTECRVLPVASTTAERMAEYIGLRLLADLKKSGLERLGRLRIELEESAGRLAICEF